MEVTALAGSLRQEAKRADERRLLVLAGDRSAGHATAREALSGTDVDPDSVTVVTTRDRHASDAPGWEVLDPGQAGELLGTTREAVVLDAHAGFSPNVLGRVVGAVDGGGLLVLLTPPLATWPDRRTDFDETMAVPPFGVEDVTGRFRERLVGTLRLHPGVAVVDVDEGTIERDGLTNPEQATTRSAGTAPPPNASFPEEAYEACLTTDQGRALRALEALRTPDNAIVVEADRGRGKSSAAGLAAAALAIDGDDVLVTAPSFRATRACFERAAGLLGSLGQRAGPTAEGGPAERSAAEERSAERRPEEPSTAEERSAARRPGEPSTVEGRPAAGPTAGDDCSVPRTLSTVGGGRVRFVDVENAVALPEDPDVVVVDEAAALPVRRLERFLAAPAVAFCTTIHGYEGAGRGFDVRFRERLADSGHRVREVELSEPIRYAAGDPLEAWSFRALLLDASPAVAPAIEDATPESVQYRAPTSDDLLEDEHLLREAFGLLVVAHYRTEPNDLGRLLDAPNLRVRLLTHEGHVVSVAMLAREGDLDRERRASMYEGSRVRGNMIPDLLTSQLRDEDAGAPVGYRVVRIATHHAVRERRLGSGLLRAIEREAAQGEEPTVATDDGSTAATDDGSTAATDDGSTAATEEGPAATKDEGSTAAKGERRTPEGSDWSDPPPQIEVPSEPERRLDAVDWLGVGYGATPELLRFWDRNGYRAVHFSTTRNDRSGEYSAIMLRPLTDAGAALLERHGRRFRDRVAGLLSDPVRDADVDVIRALLRTIPAAPDLSLTAYEQRVAASAAYGPGLADVAPDVFRDLALAAFLVEPLPARPGSGERPLSTIDARERRLLVRKCLQAQPWSTVADELGYVSTRECLRTFGETMQPLVAAFCGDPAREERQRYTE